jgi:hypothetical protein
LPNAWSLSFAVGRATGLRRNLRERCCQPDNRPLRRESDKCISTAQYGYLVYGVKDHTFILISQRLLSLAGPLAPWPKPVSTAERPVPMENKSCYSSHALKRIDQR